MSLEVKHTEDLHFAELQLYHFWENYNNLTFQD